MLHFHRYTMMYRYMMNVLFRICACCSICFFTYSQIQYGSIPRNNSINHCLHDLKWYYFRPFDNRETEYIRTWSAEHVIFEQKTLLVNMYIYTNGKWVYSALISFLQETHVITFISSYHCFYHYHYQIAIVLIPMLILITSILITMFMINISCHFS